ncbi:hypothetical protein Sango_1248900 [Sesamum angolense]|uniref:DDE Tnp4 domain-containing protein n=1 Tax=Sesamum angolense TaxID=2727404 RepID=A0AAE1WQM0_9LAMI|nr:hypothetical protein Sango_1248900 [Sesamum angolense]
MRARQNLTLVVIALQQAMVEMVVALILFTFVIDYLKSRSPRVRRRGRLYTLKTRIHDQVRHLHRLVSVNDESCLQNLCMDRNTFARLCYLLERCGVNAILGLHPLLLAKLITVSADNNCPRWKWFEGCLGALNNTYIDIRVPAEDRAHYRICKGNYYLVDNGYSNGEGFLSPYHRVRYHLKEWNSGRNAPKNHEEYFNMKHAETHNVIERTFDLLKARWIVLRSSTFYSINVPNHIIMACCLLHNFIRMEMDIDLVEQVVNYECLLKMTGM